MAYREVRRLEPRELISRWQAGERTRSIAVGLGIARDTIDMHLIAAERLGFAVSGPPPPDAQLSPVPKLGNAVSSDLEANSSDSRLASYQDQIETWLQQERLQLTRILELLSQQGAVVH